MKITIIPFEKKEECLDAVMLYNLVKRWEEDLKTANPYLTDFKLEIKMHPSFIKYNSSPNATYRIVEEGSTVHLTIPSHPGQEPTRVYQAVKDHLVIIRNDQYHVE
jgi:hypothetical protein